MSHRIHRRGLLAAALAAGALTQVSFLRGAKVARAAAPMKALFVYVPDGCIPSLWHANGTGTAFTLPAMTEPLTPIKNDLVFLKGLDMFAGGATHEGGIRKVLTGAGDVSLDVFLGSKLQGAAPFSSVQLGVAANFQNGSGSMSFVGPAQEVKPDDNPLNAFQRLFGNVAAGADSAAEKLKKLQRKSVLDAAIADLTGLQGRLGTAEKARLSTHMESLREVEKRINAAGTCQNVAFNAEGFKVNPTDYYPKTYEKEDAFGTVGKLQMDLAVQALACNVTRVASLMWSHPVSPTRIAAAQAGLANHDASHFGSPDSATAQDFVKLKRWFMQQFVYLVQGLKAAPGSAGGTLFDETIVFLCTELGDSNNHDHKNMPFLLAGGRAAGLTTGRALDYTGKHQGQNEAHSKLLVSIARACGVMVDSFGYTGHGTGGLEGLFS